MEAMEIGLVMMGVAAAIGGYLWWSRTRSPAEEEVFYFRCPGCRRRLRYRERQVGHQGACSNCGQSITFPPVSQALPG